MSEYNILLNPKVKGTSKVSTKRCFENIVLEIKRAKFQLYRVHPDGVI